MALHDPIRTDGGYVAGLEAGNAAVPLRAYRGLPYAAPPVGELRWRPPQPPQPWAGVRDGTRFSPIAAQSGLEGPPLTGSEDCLYLNVVTPAESPGARLPVMVWLHGGGYTIGSGNSLLGQGPRLPGHGIVLVLVNMRLGALGLLAHPLLSAESPQRVSGNYLHLDMVAALRWVHRNIAAFGGDPDNVTIIGQSGGGAKVANLMCSPLAAGLFHRAICQSGTAAAGFFPGRPLDENEAIGERVFRELGVRTLQEARSRPWKEVIEASLRTGDFRRMDTSADGWFMPELPERLFAAGRQHPVPFIACANLGEVTPGAATYVFPTLIPGYLNMLRGALRAGARGYACLFDQVPAGWRSIGISSIHAMELTYVFGDWDGSLGEWPNTRVLARAAFPHLEVPMDPGLTEADRRVSEAVMEMWTSFARTGVPQVPGATPWAPWNPDADNYLYIADPLEPRRGFSRVSGVKDPSFVADEKGM